MFYSQADFQKPVEKISPSVKTPPHYLRAPVDHYHSPWREELLPALSGLVPEGIVQILHSKLSFG